MLPCLSDPLLVIDFVGWVRFELTMVQCPAFTARWGTYSNSPANPFVSNCLKNVVQLFV